MKFDFPNKDTVRVKDLAAQLAKLDQEMPVIASSDSEGNSYSPVGAFSETKYLANEYGSGEVWNAEEYEGPPEDLISVFCIWP